MLRSSKLCFVSADHARAPRSDAGTGKQSFHDMCVPKLELGNEGWACGFPQSVILNGASPWAEEAEGNSGGWRAGEPGGGGAQ
jgi:hypothetical protein